MVSVTIIGAGRVGGAIALSLPSDRYSIDCLVYRGGSSPSAVHEKFAHVSSTVEFNDLKRISSDIVFITTQDAEIVPTARKISAFVEPTSTVFHTSGSYPSSILEDIQKAGCKTGSIHPLVSISDPVLGPTRFRDAFFCVEGMAAAVETGTQIVSDLGGKPFSVDTNFKTLYHAAAVTACGHLVALFDAAVEMMAKCGLSPEDSKTILMPLVLSTVNNLNEQSTPAALTGTFARADIETFTRHLATLNENVSDDLLEIYLLLGERSLELAAKQGVNRDRIDKLRTKVSIAKSKLKW